MASNNRILSIDIMRGLTLFLMLFVNDLYTPGVPKWLVHIEENEDGLGLADWVFPGFLFMVGLSIPFAFMAREKLKESSGQLLIHIFGRTISLLIIGVFMVNASNGLNKTLTGMSETLWIVLGYISIFLIWNKYQKGNKVSYLKYLGILLLAYLAFIYRNGTEEEPTFIQKGWWGILGLIGWGYFAASLVYFFFQKQFFLICLSCLAFLALNILSPLGLLIFLEPLGTVFDVIISGNTPMIVLIGLVIGVLLKKHRNEPNTFLKLSFAFGVFIIIIAFILHHWFIFSKIKGTPSWGLLCSGISILLFSTLYFIIDMKSKAKLFWPFKPAGENSLSTYLAPDIVYYLLWSLPFQVLVYKQDEEMWLAVLGSLIWAFAMIGLAALLSKFNIKLKL